MSKYILVFFLLGCTLIYSFASENKLVKLSQEFLSASRDSKSTETYITQMSKLTEVDLKNGLKNDKEKLAFWLNMYNGFIQAILKKHPEMYEDRGTFFKKQMINIGGQSLAFADIEHGIIRHSQYEYFLGYVTNPFASSFEKNVRVDKKDFRVHFALNCGAIDCPPVAIYDDQVLDKQLDESSRRYLTAKTRIDDGVIYTTTLFKWFRGDFGGGDGIRKIIEKYTSIKPADKTITTDPYDWTLSLGNFITLLQ